MAEAPSAINRHKPKRSSNKLTADDGDDLLVALVEALERRELVPLALSEGHDAAHLTIVFVAQWKHWSLVGFAQRALIADLFQRGPIGLAAATKKLSVRRALQAFTE